MLLGLSAPLLHALPLSPAPCTALSPSCLHRPHLLLLVQNYGVAVTDIDGDGEFEMVVAGFGAANIALKWDAKTVCSPSHLPLPLP